MAAASVDLMKMKVPELKLALKEKGLPTSGTKAELVKRLGEALGAKVDSSNDVLEDNIDDILNDDSVLTTVKKGAEVKAATTAAALANPAAKEVKLAPQSEKSDTVSSNGVTAKPVVSTSSAEDTTVVGKPAEVAKLSDAERLKIRAAKFGVTSTDAKKELRAQRFGLPTTGATGGTASQQTSGELERLKKRADRFGTVVSPSLSKVDEEERKRKRQERFGASASTTVKTTTVSGSFDLDNEAKRRKRAERFGLPT